MCCSNNIKLLWLQCETIDWQLIFDRSIQKAHDNWGIKLIVILSIYECKPREKHGDTAGSFCDNHRCFPDKCYTLYHCLYSFVWKQIFVNIWVHLVRFLTVFGGCYDRDRKNFSDLTDTAALHMDFVVVSDLEYCNGLDWPSQNSWTERTQWPQSGLRHKPLGASLYRRTK